MSFPQWLTNSWLAPSERRHCYYNTIIAACQAIANDVTSTHGHGGLDLATGACDNLCLLGSPEASNMATSHYIHTHTQFHSETPTNAAKCVLIQSESEFCSHYYFHVKYPRPPPLPPCHSVHRLHVCHLAHGFVVML